MMKIAFNTLSKLSDKRNSINARQSVKEIVQKTKCAHAGNANPITHIKFNHTIKVIAAAKGADNV
jgi:hypothetical protein